MTRRELENFDSHPLGATFREAGLPEVPLRVGLAILKEALECLPESIRPEDSLGKYLQYRPVDSDFDWFWLSTTVELGKMYGLSPENVGDELGALGWSTVETVDDYVRLVVRFSQSKSD